MRWSDVGKSLLALVIIASMFFLLSLAMCARAHGEETNCKEVCRSLADLSYYAYKAGFERGYAACIKALGEARTGNQSIDKLALLCCKAGSEDANRPPSKRTLTPEYLWDYVYKQCLIECAGSGY